MSTNEERVAAGFLPPTSSGQQALLVISPGVAVKDLNDLWGGVSGRWLSQSAYCTLRSEGGVSIVRFLLPGDTGGAAAGNSITIADGTTENFLVAPGYARLDYNIVGGALKFWKSSVSF